MLFFVLPDLLKARGPSFLTSLSQGKLHFVQDCYRHAASLLLLRPGEGENASPELLLLHKPRKKDAWQLPQGGFEEGETAEQCAVRELREEAGITDIVVTGKSSLVYQYDFPASYRRFRPDHICGQKIDFVFGTATRDIVVTVDAKEVDKYVWITIKQLSSYVKRKEYLELVKHLYEEAVNG